MSGSSSRRGLWISIGAVVLVAGIVGAVLLWSAAAERRDSTIEQFARAPIGCDTTLDFIEPGEYVLFVETVGTIESVRGDCDVDGEFDSSDAGDLDVEITLVDPDGAGIDVDRSFDAIEYDAAGFVGSARFSVDIEQTDDHVLRAESDSGAVFVVAVGRDPSEGVGALRVGAVLAALGALLVGLLLMLLGGRRRVAAVPAGPWTPGAPSQPGVFVPGGAAPQGPPVYGQPGGPPAYGQPQYGHPQQPQPPQSPPQYSQAPYGQQPQYSQPQYAQTEYSQPDYQQPQQAPNQQPPQPQPQFEQPAFQQPEYQQPGYQRPQVPPPPPSIPGQPAHPGSPQAPADPAGSVQPIEWAPQAPAAPAASQSATAPPDEEFLARLRDERATQERPPPPPPE